MIFTVCWDTVCQVSVWSISHNHFYDWTNSTHADSKGLKNPRWSCLTAIPTGHDRSGRGKLALFPPNLLTSKYINSLSTAHAFYLMKKFCGGKKTQTTGNREQNEEFCLTVDKRQNLPTQNCL